MRSGGHILIVEDDDAMREMLAHMLEGDGYETIQAATGESAIAAAADERPALVLLDVHLPGASGYEVCRRLRDRFGEHLPIIFVSGSRADPEDRVAGLLIGADDYVSKPFLADELLARVRRLLVRSGEGSDLDQIPGDRSLRNGGVPSDVRLTKRELEILCLLADGLNQKAIATELVISTKTVATHIQRILAKLGVHSRAEAVAFAYRNGLIEDVEAHMLVQAAEYLPPPGQPQACSGSVVDDLRHRPDEPGWHLKVCGGTPLRLDVVEDALDLPDRHPDRV